MLELWKIPLSKLLSSAATGYIFTPKFYKLLNDAAIQSNIRRGRVKSIYVCTIREAIHPEVAELLSEDTLDTSIYFASEVIVPDEGRTHPVTFLIGHPVGSKTYILVMHPEQARADYVPGLIHEIKHLEDLHVGKKVTTTEEVKPWEKGYELLPSERRATAAASRLIKQAHKRSIRKAMSEGKRVSSEILADYPELKPIHRGGHVYA